MLEYRQFPLKTSIGYLLFFPYVTYFIYLINSLIGGTYFSSSIDQLLLLGYGALAAAITIPICGIMIDWVNRPLIGIYAGSLVPLLLALYYSLIGFSPNLSPLIETTIIVVFFCGFVIFMMSWVVRLNRTVVVRFRGRVSSSFLISSLLLYFVFEFMIQNGYPLIFLNMQIQDIAALLGILLSLSTRPWIQKEVPLAVRAKPISYFVPMIALLACHMLWYFSTKLAIDTGMSFDPSYVSLAQLSGFGSLELVVLAIGIAVSGIIADLRGRKTAFSMAILLMGLLAIFSTAFYWYSNPGVISSFRVEAVPLLVVERLIEGFIFGSCLLLIWTEIGSPKAKGFHLSSMWIFFLGYMALFWALNLGVWNIPSWVQIVGGQFSILLALVSLYFSGHLPQILGREVEMEELELDFDDKEVKKTVEAFLGDEDFESIQSQLTILDAGEELSDSDMTEILGSDVPSALPLRRVPGIGEALESKLRKAGYTSAAQLAEETALRLARKVKGLSQARAEKLVSEARKIVDKTFNGK